MLYIRKNMIAPAGVTIERYHRSRKGNDAEKKLRQIINKNFNSEGEVKLKLQYVTNEK